MKEQPSATRQKSRRASGRSQHTRHDVYVGNPLCFVSKYFRFHIPARRAVGYGLLTRLFSCGRQDVQPTQRTACVTYPYKTASQRKIQRCEFWVETGCKEAHSSLLSCCLEEESTIRSLFEWLLCATGVSAKCMRRYGFGTNDAHRNSFTLFAIHGHSRARQEQISHDMERSTTHTASSR